MRNFLGGSHVWPCVLIIDIFACRAFGPTAAAAELEGSKAFLKVDIVRSALIGATFDGLNVGAAFR